MQLVDVSRIVEDPESVLRFYNVARRLGDCPNAILVEADITARVEGANQAAAQQRFEDQIDKDIEKQSGLTCNAFTCIGEAARCEFDYVLGDITVKQIRPPGKKTKRHSITVANGLWEFSTTISAGCWCVERA